MKKLILNSARIIALLAIVAGLGACKGYLDVEPKDQVSDASIWTSTTNADIFLNQVYGALPSPYRDEDPEENQTDHAMGKPNSGSTTWKKAGYSPASPGASAQVGSNTSLWGFYQAIRRANMFIENVGASTTLPAAFKKSRVAEARFLRAYFYSLLWTHYGGVPVITDVLNITEDGDAVFRARNTDAETYKFIVDECTAIAPDLANAPAATAAGRPSRGAALTLKAWADLWWASPLKNTTNDLARWTTAANSYKAVMDLNVYSLFNNYGTMLYEANERNAEVIFAKEHIGATGSLGSHREGQWGAFNAGGSQQAWCGVNPTHDIVDAYRMANGKLITDPTSGYNPQKPYEGREKRFYSSITYDGAVWLGFTMNMKQQAGNPNATDINNSSDATNTGYYLRKGLEERNAANGANNLSGADFYVWRYAEVLLAYAEAKNEASGPDASIYTAINLVRARVGVELPPLSGLTQAQLRDAIQEERRVELFMEERRWYDLIRLKKAETILNGTSKAMRIDLVAGVPVYSVINAAAGAMKFVAPLNYLAPIPTSNMNVNPKLVQNTGY